MSARAAVSWMIACLLVAALPAHRARAQEVEPPPGEGAVQRAVAASRRALATVRCGDARIGTAFAIDGEHRLVTTWGAADCARRLSVEGPDGRRAAARVAAADADHDLALLVADGLALEALTIRDDAIEIGAQIVALGFIGGAVGLVAHGGAVAQVTPALVRTDAAHPGIAGGPVLDAEGRVVGVAASAWDATITHVVPAHWVTSLAEGATHDGDVRAPVRIHGGIAVGVLVIDERALFLADAHLSIDLWDELSLRGTLQVAGASATEWAPQPTERSDSLVGGSLTLGYRVRFQLDDALALTLTPELGASVGLHSTTDTRGRLGFADAACDPSMGACELVTSTETLTREQWLVRPVLGLRVGFGDILELGYQVQLDVERPEDSAHLVTFGARL